MDFNNVTTGDLVGVSRSYGWTVTSRLVKVERVTKTRVIVGGLKYRKSDGILVDGNCPRASSWLVSREEAESNIANQAKERKIKIAASDLKKATEALRNPDAEALDAIQAKLDALRALI